MKIEKFLAFVLRGRYSQITHRYIYSGYNGEYVEIPDEFVFVLKNSTATIDFGCKFDKSGLCTEVREEYEEEYTKTRARDLGQCCCCGCSSSVGHLKHITYDTLGQYAELFDKNNGYWTPNGCVLPRELRSEVCLSYHCRDFDPHIRSHARALVILEFIHDCAGAWVDYQNWYGQTETFLGHKVLDKRVFSKFITSWVTRLNGEIDYPLEIGTWGKYYKKHPHVPESSPVKRSRRRT